MKALKIVAILLLLSVVCLAAFGCAESFTYAEYIDEHGEVHHDFLLVYDVTEEDAATVKEQAKKTMLAYVETKGFKEYAAIDDSIDGEVTLHLTFPSVTDYYIACGYTGREENEPNVPAEKGIINRYDTEKSSYLTEASMDFVRSLTEEEYRDFPVLCDFYYTYGTTSKLTESNGEVKKVGNVYYHTWKLDYGSPTNMVISTYSLNGVIVISAIISVFVLSLAVIFVIIIINGKKNKRARAAEDEASTPIE